MNKRAPPSWINKYREDYENDRITAEEIFKRENADREAKKKPVIKFKSVNRAINALGFSYNPLKPVQEQKIKPCFGCKYYTIKYICEYPRSMFDIYPELSNFDKDFSEGRCKLKEA